MEDLHDCEVVPIHELPEAKRKQAVEYCCYILNREWPCHGYSRREKWLMESNPNFPFSLVMFSLDGPQRKAKKNPKDFFNLPKKKKPVMIGHSRLCKVQGEDDVCFIGSVIVDPDWRGRGYGRRLMELTERYALNEHGFKRAYLDIERAELVGFYRGLGYRRGVTSHRDPVVPIDAQDPSTVEKFADFLKEYSPVTIMRDFCEWFGALLPEGVSAGHDGHPSGPGGDARPASSSSSTMSGPWTAVSSRFRNFLDSNKLTYWTKNLKTAWGPRADTGGGEGAQDDEVDDDDDQQRGDRDTSPPRTRSKPASNLAGNKAGDGRYTDEDDEEVEKYD